MNVMEFAQGAARKIKSNINTYTQHTKADKKVLKGNQPDKTGAVQRVLNQKLTETSSY